MRFRAKPCQIEAVQWNGNNVVDILDLTNFTAACCEFEGRRCVEIKTLEGIMRGEVGDWIVKGLKGEFYPVKPDIFAMKYEAVESETREL